MPWGLVKPVIDYGMAALCRTPYPGHSKGCPNWGKKSGCPPQCLQIERLLDLKQEVWAVWNKFDIGSHIDRMRGLHPDWSDRQLRCCLYWQQGARKQMMAEWFEFCKQHPNHGLRLVRCPEASGVVLSPTMEQLGEKLEWPPQKWAYQILLAGKKNPDFGT